ncbi:MAG: DUF3575 domain-containing protein [Bacteroidetes bacterium]|nr:DUF3575 domain-containing protein [Bacteroidota bacterium]
MKKICLFVVGLFILSALKAQDNGVGLVITSLGMRTIKVRYERKLGDKISVGTHLGYQLSSDIMGIHDPEYDVTAKYYGINASPEFRFYPGGEAMNGFYLGAYMRLAQRTLKYTDNFDFYEDRATGKLNTIGGGFQMGTQWVIKDVVGIDFYWLGIGVCRHNIKLEFESDDPTVDYESWKNEIDSEWSDIPMIGKKLTTDATSHSLEMQVPFMFFDFRFGLAVSFMF